MTSSFRRTIVALLLAGAVFAGACGEATPQGVDAKNIKQLPPDIVQGPILGLNVAREDVSKDVSKQEASAYIAAVGLYSLRDKDRLEATLQVSEFTSKARPKSRSFQAQFANQVGGTKSQAYVMGGKTVYRSSARKQSIATWFSGDYVMVLSVRDTYPTPRTLLRTLMSEVKPK